MTPAGGRSGRSGRSGPGPAGHRTVPHTADLGLQAWGPTREACVAQAVLGMVAAFVDTSYDGDLTQRTLPLDAVDDVDLLVAALEEVVYLLDVAGEVPLDVAVTAPTPGTGAAAELHLRTAPADALEQVGAVPKAVSLHGVRCAPDADGWSCAVTLDV